MYQLTVHIFFPTKLTTIKVIRDRREILKRKENCHSHMPKGSLNNNNLTFQGNQGDLPSIGCYQLKIFFLNLI